LIGVELSRSVAKTVSVSVSVAKTQTEGASETQTRMEWGEVEWSGVDS
jgi:hypothetical protein